MKAFIKLFAATVMTFSLSNASEYNIDKSHTNVGFSVKHLMITNVKGEFKDFGANIDFDAVNKTFKIFKAVIKTASVDTGIEKRDNHLRSDDFFLSDKYPEMTFAMTSYKDGKMAGDLTIRGITKPVVLDVEELATVKDFEGNSRVGFALKGKINRMDFGLKWNKALELGGVAVSEEVKLTAEVEAVEASKK
jgi:polyisoprenoid-binding protein YceI